MLDGKSAGFTGDLTVQGIQGHVAYPHLADNPHKIAPALSDLVNEQWDEVTRSLRQRSKCLT